MVVWREIAVPTSLCIRSSHLYSLPCPLYISLLPLLALTLRWLAVGPPLRDCRLLLLYTPGRLGFFTYSPSSP